MWWAARQRGKMPIQWKNRIVVNILKSEKSFLVDQKYSVRKTGAQIDALTFISFKHAQQMNLWRHFTGAQSALTNGKSEREIREYEGWKEWTSSGAPTRIDI